MTNELIGRIKKIIESSKNDKLKIGESYYFNQRDTIRRAVLYSFSQFAERKSDAIFWNIGNSRVVHFSKNLELDTKDLQPYGEYSFVQGFILRQLMSKAYEQMDLYQTLNDIAEDLAAFGSAVVKEYKDDKDIKLERVPLLDLYFDQSAKNIRDVDTVREYNLSRQDILEKKDVWDGVEEFLDKKENKDKQNFCVREFWGYVDGEYRQAIVSEDLEKGKVFFNEPRKLEDNPYHDFHCDSWRGRWLRIGVWERLFKLQERANQLVNQNAQATEIASLLLFRTANVDVQGNLLDSALNGQIINSEDLQQIGINNTGLNNFLNELKLIEDKADTLCLTPAFISGEQAPSGTPFRSLATMTNAAKSAFRMAKQNIGEKFGRVVKERLMKPIVAGWNSKDMEVLVTDEADVEVYKEALKKRSLIKKLLSGTVITPDVENALDGQMEAMAGKLEPKVVVPKGFFDFDYAIKMNVTGESVDKAQMNDAMNNAIQMISQNPALNEIPLFKQYLENNSITWWKLTPKQKAEMAQGLAVNPQTQKQDTMMGMVDSNK